jgi:hypothetical protein
MRAKYAVALLGALVACSSSDGNDSTQDRDIQGGTADAGHPGVGLIWFQGGGFCTGTLISPSVVLTAGHCVQDPIDGFYTGTGAPSPLVAIPPGMTKHPVDRMIAHPSYAAGACPNATFDIGLVHLAQPVTDIPTTDYARNGLPAVGTACTAVGFGTHTESGLAQYGQKRTGTETVQGNVPTAIQVSLGTALADHGDSGGPLLCGGVIAGTTSCHSDGDWPAHQVESYAWVAAASQWIGGQIAAWGTPPPPPPPPPAGVAVTNGLYGSLALVVHNSVVTGSVHEGSCEFTVAGQSPPNGGPFDIQIITNTERDPAELEGVDATTVRFTASTLPRACSSVFDPGALSRGLPLTLRANLPTSVSAFRTIQATRAFFHDAPGSPARNVFVIASQTIREHGEAVNGFVSATYTSVQGTPTQGFLAESDLAPLGFDSGGL